MKEIKLVKVSSAPQHKMGKQALNEKLSSLRERMFALQHLFYANADKSMLIIFQGMDTSGKDSTIRHVFSCINPLGVHAYSFTEPCDREQKHDFLWRIYQQLPEKGRIQIFNRSHYEDILVPSIHQLLDKSLIERRYDAINSFEQELIDNGTIILKFYLHLSKKEQHKRLEKRKSDPLKKWKYKKSDKTEAKKWQGYMKVYERILNDCSSQVPWQIVPADDKQYRNYLVAKAIVDTLEGLKLKYPGQ
ncbi:MAG: polyphosphate kinase [Bacteroidetes bacterium 46-16]|nr:MAG: polyphosphate kinase [Bacteroidetes bacterium 46-16]